MQSVWTTIAGLKMHARVWERAGAPAVVLVPGLGMSGRYTAPTAALLAERWRVLAPDLPGFGRSDKPPHALDVPELAQSLAAWIEALRLRGATLVGNSFGCQVIAQLATSDPGILAQAAGIVMIAPTIEPGARQTWRQLLRFTHTALVEPLSLVPIATADYFRAGPRRVWRTFQFALRDRIEDKLPHIVTPALVVDGERDPLISRRWAAQTAEVLPHGRLATIPRAAHALYYNSPRELARLIDEFATGARGGAEIELSSYGT